jgi:CRP-like cAMP-binding protein
MASSTPLPVMDPAVIRRAHTPWSPAREAISPIHALVRKLDGYAVLAEQDREALARFACYVRSVERYAVLVEQDFVADHAVIVCTGIASRCKRRVSGRRLLLAYLIPGDHCDRGALFGYPLDHTIETLTPCQIAKVPRGHYLDMLERHPRIALAFQRAKLAEEATGRVWMANIGMRSGPERLAHLLCELLERHGSIGQVTDDQFDLPLTQADLADALGLTSVHVNRVMQALRRSGLIALRGRRLRILAPRRLRELAEFEGGYL